MKMTRQIAPWVVAAGLVAAVGFAPVAAAAPTAYTSQNGSVGRAGTDPMVPYGTDPAIPFRLGYINSNHDEANVTNGFVDSAF
jgi:hypothetical protein